MGPLELPVAHHTAATNGVRLHYVEAGDRSGPIAVLLHGFPEFWYSWRYQIAPLVEAGYRVIVPDQRGYNDSEKHGPYDRDTLAADIAGLLDVVGAKRASIVGHDLGGALTWHFGARYPAMCERLVVLNCPHPEMFLRALRQSSVQRRLSWYMFMFQVPFIPERYLVRNNAEPIARAFYTGAVDRTRLDERKLAHYRAAMSKPGAARAAVGWYRAWTREALMRRARGPLPRIEAPTTLIWARPDFALDYDSVVPGTERYVRDLTIKTVDGVGHFCQTEAPERINPLLLEALNAGGAASGVNSFPADVAC